MTSYVVCSHNRKETALTLRTAKALARLRALEYADAHGGRVVWCAPDDGLDHGGYFIRRDDGVDDELGAAVIW